VTEFQKFRVLDRIPRIEPHAFVPRVSDRNEPGIERGAQIPDNAREGIAKIFVLAFAEAVPVHDDAAGKVVIVGIE